mmetsp:Transcript_42709/g.110428  ORF Transcript_42709/g.110428 Transcript_42709/m.110428 type:complete len:262 (-) Transcript_42709:935-1720(-)
MQAAKVHAQVAVSAQTPLRDALLLLRVVAFQRLSFEGYPVNKLPSQVWRQHCIRDANRQRARKEPQRPHWERRQEALITAPGPVTLDDVQQDAPLTRLAQDWSTSEAGKDGATCELQQLPQPRELRNVLCLFPNKIVYLVHDHDLVRVNVLADVVEGHLEERADWQTVIAELRVPATCGGVSQGTQWCAGEALRGEALHEGITSRASHLAHKEPTLHLQHLPQRGTELAQLRLRQCRDIPEPITALTPIAGARCTRSILGP